MITFNLHTKYGALNSKPVFEAFATGAKRLGYRTFDNSRQGDIDVIWSVCWNGRMAPNKKIWDEGLKPIIVLEVGALKRNVLWKVGFNGIGYGCYDTYSNYDYYNDPRVKKLNLQLKDHKHNENGPIMFACQQGNSGQFESPKHQYHYIRNVLKEVRKYTDRKIIIREHPRYPLKLKDLPHNTTIQKPNRIPNTYDDYDFDLNNAYAVINYSSNPGTLAAIEGVPVWTHHTSLAYPVSQLDWKDIEKPAIIDRTRWIRDIAYTEWDIEEISKGDALMNLTYFFEDAIINV